MADSTGRDPAVETVSSLPGLAGVFARAVVTGRGTGGDVLPERALRIEGLAVERERLTAYQRLCGFDVSDTLPPTFPHVLGFPLQASLMAHGDFPLALAGMVHLENDIAVHRPLAASDPLTITVRAEGLRPHPRGRVVDLITAVDSVGERVWEGRSVYLSRGRGDEDASRGSAPPPMPPGDPVAIWSLASDLGRAYAAVSGDVNPIHLHPLTAKAMGFPRHLVHGMWSYARVLAALGRPALGASRSHVWFTKPVFLPSRVALVRTDDADGTVAGLRSATDPDRSHLVSRLVPAG